MRKEWKYSSAQLLHLSGLSFSCLQKDKDVDGQDWNTGEIHG